MFRWLGRMVTTYAPVIIIIILLISMGFALVIPKIEFKTNLNRFLPDNDIVRANERVGEYFGDDSAVHIIYIQDDNSKHDVLTPDALQQQYDIYQECKNKYHVENVVSIVSMIDGLFEVVFEQFYNESYPGFSDLSDQQLESGKTLMFQLLNGSIDIAQFDQLLNLPADVSLDALRQLVDIFLDKDFDYHSQKPTAKSTLMIIFINGSLDDTVLKETSVEIRDTITTDNYNELIISHTGSYLISADLDEASSESFSMLGIAIIVLITIILSLSFRRLSYVIIPLVTLGLAVVWTFGSMILLGIEFTVITVAIIPLIIGLGVDYSVYISKRYQEELHRGKDISESLKIAVGSVGTAMFLAMFTTIIAFMSNLSSSIAPVREFGLVCGLGVFYAFLLTITFNTSARWLIDIKSSKNPRIGKEKELYVVELGTHTASRSVLYYPILVMVVVVVITLAAVTFAMNVRTEFNDKDFLPNDWESLQTHTELEESFNGSSFSQTFILLETTDIDQSNGYGSLATIDVLKKIQDIEENIRNDKYVVRVNDEPRIETVVHHVQNAIRSNLSLAVEVNADSDDLPADDAGVRMVFDHLYLASATSDQDDPGKQYTFLLQSDIARILSRDENGVYRSTLIRVYITTEDSHEVREMYSELKDDISAEDIQGVKSSATGNAILTVTTMDSLQDSQVMSTIIAVIFALVILIIIYRNVILGLIAITPVLISSIWILGTMYIFGISINVFTVSITALTIGLGIDYGIHIIERFREELKKHDKHEAINRTIRNTGAALFISALTTVCGFIVLIISPIPPIQHFGVIAGMTIVYSSILAMVVIPIMLLKWSSKKKE